MASSLTSPELAIAKAALSASLFRADPTSLSRPAVEAFFPLLDAAVKQCSRPNVQTCKDWIVDNVAPSPARTAALAKFLAAQARSFAADNDDDQKPAEARSRPSPSPRRKRLHVLYIVSDVLHHVVVRQRQNDFGALWDKHLPALVASAAAFDKCPKHQAKLARLVELWDEKRYMPVGLVAQLRRVLESGGSSTTEPAGTSAAAATADGSAKLAKDTPYLLPSFHGDSSTAWYDLPASTWLPHMAPNSTKPMLPDLIRPIQLAPGRPDKSLVTAVQDLLADVELLFSRDPRWDTNTRGGDDSPATFTTLNDLGERVVVNSATGQIVRGETYYGWSRAFCERMKERRWKRKVGLDRPPSRSLSRSPERPSRSRSRSSSRQPAAFKRRRDSRSSSRGRSTSRGRTPDQQHKRRRSYSRSISASRSRSRSRSPDRSRHYAQAKDAPSAPIASHNGHWQSPPFPPYPLPDPSTAQFFPPVPPPGSFPPPPPPPVGYQGHWPPPPPPPPAMGVGVPQQNWFPPNPNVAESWGAVPPPPPQPPATGPSYQGGHRYGRGSNNNNFRGRGRGGYGQGYGRGR